MTLTHSEHLASTRQMQQAKHVVVGGSGGAGAGGGDSSSAAAAAEPMGVLPELVFGQQHSYTHQYPARFASHAIPAVPHEGDQRPLAASLTTPQQNLVPVSVPFQQAVMYPGYSNCAVYPTATRGSFSSLNRRQSSGEIAAVDLSSEDTRDDSPNSVSSQREVCRYFMRTGTCGYGDKCRYHHPQSAHRPKLNSMGYPQREAEHACPFYLKNGWCGFGATCKFNHPELPPLNVPVTTLVPQMIAPVPYTLPPPPPPYANVPTAYSMAPAAPAPMMHWPVAPAGVPTTMMSIPPPAAPQSGMYHQPYVSLPAVPAWSAKDRPMTLGSYGNAPAIAPRRTASGTTPVPAAYSKQSIDYQFAEGAVVQRHDMSPQSEDSAFSAMGRDVSLPRHASMVAADSKHALMAGRRLEEASRVSVTNA